MKVLAQICSLNDEDVIDQSLHALLNQTYPLDRILIVDNGSTDSTLDRPLPGCVTVIRNSRNLGTSGGAEIALRYGIDHGYDWVWTFDADSAPPPDGLERLIKLYESFDPALQAKVRVLACLPVDVATGSAHHGIRFTPDGFEPVDSERNVYECDTTIWSGSLFRIPAVMEIGLPRTDYVLDWGENEFGYRGKMKGFRTFVDQRAKMAHNIGSPGGPTGPRERIVNLGIIRYRLPILPPIRLYYIYRNMTYFFLHEYYQGDLIRFARFARWMPRHLAKLVLAGRVWPDLWTCVRGFWNGYRKQLNRWY